MGKAMGYGLSEPTPISDISIGTCEVDHRNKLRVCFVKRFKCKRGDLVFLTWIDSFTPVSSVWIMADDVEDIPPDFVIESVGFFYGENDSYVLVVGDLHEDCIARPMYIPKVAIRSFEVLKRSRRK